MPRPLSLGILLAVMSRLRAIRVEVGWVAFIVVILLSGFWWLPGAAKGFSDTFSAAAGGKKLFFVLAQKLVGDVHRRADRSRLPTGATVATGTLLMLGPARYPDGAEWVKLHQWVTAGGVLIFAARVDDPSVDLGPFGLKVVFRSDDEDTKKPPDKNAKNDKNDKKESRPKPSPALTVDPELVEGKFEWNSVGWIEGASSDAWTPVTENGLPLVVYQDVGEGAIVVVSSDDLFTNATLVKQDNAVLAFRLVEMASVGSLFFDETLNASGAPKAVGLLFDERLRPLSLQALLCVVIFGWWGSRRFGPPRPAEKALRRDVTEHAVALGNLHYKVGTGSHVVASYLEFFRRELRFAHLTGHGADAAELVARRAQVEVSTVRQALGIAQRVASQPYAVAAQAATAVRALAKLREKVDRPRVSARGVSRT